VGVPGGGLIFNEIVKRAATWKGSRVKMKWGRVGQIYWKQGGEDRIGPSKKRTFTAFSTQFWGI